MKKKNISYFLFFMATIHLSSLAYIIENDNKIHDDNGGKAMAPNAPVNVPIFNREDTRLVKLDVKSKQAIEALRVKKYLEKKNEN